jgi:hypothetical protein
LSVVTYAYLYSFLINIPSSSSLTIYSFLINIPSSSPHSNPWFILYLSILNYT